ncbi:MAG: chemoreceptor glutamine deamidase CheD [Geothrix sp.]|jgi:chemotaxis protein CheD|uniref:Probable chemoreceptor glutamine deamidase CheD n=1 Tax=Candidatus Geothrix odensensis TaxID=2954440 RepID=A0A936K6L9_9BACT|nr:chemoreceptor glutamine deamidase CheD [Candidatus Geothrix odensensis]MBP7617485.1 chemoreceptor glutamine deamidase CheD [Geothrix sp.]
MSPPVPLVHGRASKYLDRSFNRLAMKILPGEFYATAEDEVIVTVLGSCVAACVMDPIAMVGGMNHFMLPMKQGERDPDVFYAARYGAAAMEYLINNVLHLGAQRNRLVAKAFGGGKVLPGMSSDVGGQNVDFVREFLRNEDIPIWAEDMGGPYPRKVYFFPHTGQVLVKRMESMHNDTVLHRELTYIQEIVGRPMSGDVELFT